MKKKKYGELLKCVSKLNINLENRKTSFQFFGWRLMHLNRKSRFSFTNSSFQNKLIITHIFGEKFLGLHFLIFCQKYLTDALSTFFAGFMPFKSLMKGREVVVDVWLATIKGEGRLILILLVMEVR